MVISGERDATNLQREALLDDYYAISKRRKGALVATALRTRSVSMRDILVHGGIHGKSSSEELKSLLLSGHDIGTDIGDIEALEDLGRLVLLQGLLPGDQVFGEKLLHIADTALPGHQLSLMNKRLLIQHYILSREQDKAKELLSQAPKLDAEHFGYLRAELDNPFTIGMRESYDSWLKAFNKTFSRYDLAPIGLDDHKELPAFDRLTCCSSEGRDGGELVSVILTAYRPQETHLRTSVKSILNQTWKNLELIIVNDCSGPEYEKTFDDIGQMDSRITVINAAANQGTYVSRNIGYAASHGEFITGQDDDDWSHPERIERQVGFLKSNSHMVGCRVNGIMCNESLGRVRLGYKPIGPNASSLMVSREGYELAGGYLDARKAADTEYYYRVARAAGKEIGTLKESLSIVRILSNSLSRSDFAPGWRHTSRRSFRSSYEYWHRSSSRKELHVDKESSPPVKIPRRFEVRDDTGKLPSFDVIFAGDWQNFGGPQKSMLEEIRALLRLGYRIAIMNLEAGRFMSKSDQATLNDEVQALINNGTVDEVLYDEEVHAHLLILRYPPILQFFVYEQSRLCIDSMIILANQAPSELDGSDIRYLVQECHNNAEIAFNVSPVWVPQGPQVRDFLEKYLSPPVLASFDIPGVLDLDEWWQSRIWYRSTLPIVGRHSRDEEMKWPATKAVMNKVYPVDGEMDIRIMGGAKSPLRTIGRTTPPDGWVVYAKDEIPVTQFLQSLDYFVFYQHPNAVEAFGRAILEALASGIVVILPPHFKPVFGDAALYTEPEGVSKLINQLHSDFSIYRNHLERAKVVLERNFSYEFYQGKIENLLMNNSI